MAPQDMYGGLTSKLLVSGPSRWFFDVQRGRAQPQFDQSAITLLELFSPHLRRALEINRRSHMAGLLACASSQAHLGLLLVDVGQRILYANEAAEALLAEFCGVLCRKQGALALSDSFKAATLRRLIADACTPCDGRHPGVGGDILIKDAADNGGAMIAISVSPAADRDLQAMAMAPCALVIIRAISWELPEGFVEDIRRIFALTPKEAHLAAALAAGRSLKEIAEEAGIRPSTARTHLERIFLKTGTRQQSQLVAVLKSVQPLVRRRV